MEWEKAALLNRAMYVTKTKSCSGRGEFRTFVFSRDALLVLLKNRIGRGYMIGIIL